MEGGHRATPSAKSFNSCDIRAFINQLRALPHPLVFGGRSLGSGGGHRAADHSRNGMDYITDTASMKARCL